MSKAVMWSIRRPHTDNIKKGNKWDEIRKRIPKDLTSDTVNYIYETKGNGGCGKVIGQFRVSNKTYIYAEASNNGSKHLYNTAFIMPALSDEDLFNYLYDGKENGGWALRISDLVIYDTPKELGDFYKPCNANVNLSQCWNCASPEYRKQFIKNGCQYCRLTRPPQSWCYVEGV